MKRILIYSVGFTLLLFAFRVVYSGTLLFFFIPWNLFLAWLPLLFSSKIKEPGINFHNSVFFVLWLLFSPNAPYMITDLFHLEQREGVPMYFDLILLFTAAWNALLMGLLSFRNIEAWLLKMYNAPAVRVISVVCFLLCGFGIYLGRYLRFNSWHVITQPFDLLKEIAIRFIHPFEYPGTWAVTILFSVLMMIVYETLKQLAMYLNNKI